ESAAQSSVCPSQRYACANSESATIAERKRPAASVSFQDLTARAPALLAASAWSECVCSAPGPPVAPGSTPSNESASALHAQPTCPVWEGTRALASRNGGPPRAAS